MCAAERQEPVRTKRGGCSVVALFEFFPRDTEVVPGIIQRTYPDCSQAYAPAIHTKIRALFTGLPQVFHTPSTGCQPADGGQERSSDHR